jgi:hypothetical protein
VKRFPEEHVAQPSRSLEVAGCPHTGELAAEADGIIDVLGDVARDHVIELTVRERHRCRIADDEPRVATVHGTTGAMPIVFDVLLEENVGSGVGSLPAAHVQDVPAGIDVDGSTRITNLEAGHPSTSS